MTTRTTTRVRDQGKPGTRGVIGMTALTLAMLGGVVLWQTRQDEATPPAPVASNATSIANDGAAPIGGMAEWYQKQHAVTVATGVPARGRMAELYAERQAQVTTTATPARIIITVDSVDQVETAYGQFVEQMRAPDGSGPLEVTVVLAAGSPAGLAERAPVSDQEMYRQWQQREALRSRPVDNTVVSAAEMDRTYSLVSSEERAVTLPQEMEWLGRNTRTGLPFEDVVVVAGEREAAHIFAAAALTSDPQAVHWGLPQLRVIDLRAAAGRTAIERSPVTDQEMYSRHSAAVQRHAAERAQVSDQEMYYQWQQRSVLDSHGMDNVVVSDEEMASIEPHQRVPATNSIPSQ